MEKIGLINKFIAASNARWEMYKLAQKSVESQELIRNDQINLNMYKKIGKTKNISLILEAERLSMIQELSYRANSPEEENSLNTGIAQLDQAHASLSIVNNHQHYQIAAQTYSAKRQESGLPLDSMREFLKSHTTRLSNKLASQLTTSEKNMIRQRKENLATVKDIYIEMQREALGLSRSQDKDRGIER